VKIVKNYWIFYHSGILDVQRKAECWSDQCLIYY